MGNNVECECGKCWWNNKEWVTEIEFEYGDCNADRDDVWIGYKEEPIDYYPRRGWAAWARERARAETGGK